MRIDLATGESAAAAADGKRELKAEVGDPKKRLELAALREDVASARAAE